MSERSFFNKDNFDDFFTCSLYCSSKESQCQHGSLSTLYLPRMKLGRGEFPLQLEEKQEYWKSVSKNGAVKSKCKSNWQFIGLRHNTIVVFCNRYYKPDSVVHPEPFALRAIQSLSQCTTPQLFLSR